MSLKQDFVSLGIPMHNPPLDNKVWRHCSSLRKKQSELCIVKSTIVLEADVSPSRADKI